MTDEQKCFLYLLFLIINISRGDEAFVRKQVEGSIGLEGIGGGFWKIVFVANLGQKERGV